MSLSSPSYDPASGGSHPSYSTESLTDTKGRMEAFLASEDKLKQCREYLRDDMEAPSLSSSQKVETIRAIRAIRAIGAIRAIRAMIRVEFRATVLRAWSLLTYPPSLPLPSLPALPPLFSCMGIIMFRDTDPLHFSSISITMNTVSE